MTNLEKYKKDINDLIKRGEKLLSVLNMNKDISKFRRVYEIWYSESLSLIRIILPNRSDDFKRYYYQKGEECLKDFISYTSDYFHFMEDKAESAIPLFESQPGIVKAAKKRFESSLFDIKQVLQADLFDSEIDAAKELNKKGFTRCAGAMAGVVLEKHLAQVCENHNIKISKKDPSINDFNQLLKDNNVIEVKDWRFIQHLTDLRNLCDHYKKREPKKEEIEELIDGVKKVLENIF